MKTLTEIEMEMDEPDRLPAWMEAMKTPEFYTSPEREAGEEDFLAEDEHDYLDPNIEGYNPYDDAASN